MAKWLENTIEYNDNVNDFYDYIEIKDNEDFEREELEGEIYFCSECSEESNFKLNKCPYCNSDME